MSSMRMKFTMLSAEELIKNRGLAPGGRVQAFVDNEVIKKCAPKVPFDTGTLARSAELSSQIGYGVIRYDTPYAKRQYYEHKGTNGRGRLWFERMKADHKEEILRGAQKMAGDM